MSNQISNNSWRSSRTLHRTLLSCMCYLCLIYSLMCIEWLQAAQLSLSCVRGGIKDLQIHIFVLDIHTMAYFHIFHQRLGTTEISYIFYVPFFAYNQKWCAVSPTLHLNTLLAYNYHGISMWRENVRFMTIFFIRRQKNMQLCIHFLRLNYLPLWERSFCKRHCQPSYIVAAMVTESREYR